MQGPSYGVLVNWAFTARRIGHSLVVECWGIDMIWLTRVSWLLVLFFSWAAPAATKYLSSSTTLSVVGPAPATDFETRCKQAGVIRCHGFEPGTRFNVNDGSYARNYDSDYYPPSGSTVVRMNLDSAQKASGNSSLKAFIPAQAPADSSGSFVVRFSDDGKTQLGLNEEFYVQWRQRFTAEMIHPYASDRYPQGTAWKQTIIGAGDSLDTAGNPSNVSYSCTILEMVSNSAPITIAGKETLRYGFYHSCGYYFGMEYWFQPVNQIVMQHQGPPYCVYPNDPQGGCMLYYPDEWMTFQVHIKIGSRWANGPNDSVAGSKVEVWVARQGKPSVLVFDSSKSHPDGFPIINDASLLKYGKVWLTPYMSYRKDTVTYQDAYTWYDDLIISRNKIADPK